MQCASRVPLSRGLLNEHIQLFVRILSSSSLKVFSLSLVSPGESLLSNLVRSKENDTGLSLSRSRSRLASTLPRRAGLASPAGPVRSGRLRSGSPAPRHTALPTALATSSRRVTRVSGRCVASRPHSRRDTLAAGAGRGVRGPRVPRGAFRLASRRAPRVSRRAFPGARHLPPLRPAPRLASQACVAPLASPFHYIRYDAAPAPATAR